VEVAPDTIAKLVESLEGPSDTVAVCPLLVDPTGKPVWRVLPLPTRDVFSPVCGGEPPPFTPVPDLTQESIVVSYPGRDALLIRRNFVAGMNYFDERLGEYWADADLALQMRRGGKKFRVYPQIRATCHISAADAARAPGSSTAPDRREIADRVVGAAVLLGKYNGFFSGLGFRFGAMGKALLRFNIPLFFAILGGQQMDASKSG
jgi:GT2 family glycosyltransferase